MDPVVFINSFYFPVLGKNHSVRYKINANSFQTTREIFIYVSYCSEFEAAAAHASVLEEEGN